MLLSEHRRDRIRRRLRRRRADERREGGTGRDARGGGIARFDTPRIREQAGSEGRVERAADQRRAGVAGG